MKLLFCKICNHLVQLENDIKQCKCGNVIGRYLPDDSTIEMSFLYGNFVQIIGISNRYLFSDSEYSPSRDGGFFAEQNSAITKIPLEEADDVKIKHWDDYLEENGLSLTYQMNSISEQMAKRIIQDDRKIWGD